MRARGSSEQRYRRAGSGPSVAAPTAPVQSTVFRRIYGRQVGKRGGGRGPGQHGNLTGRGEKIGLGRGTGRGRRVVRKIWLGVRSKASGTMLPFLIS
jgi:hypothetical protein